MKEIPKTEDSLVLRTDFSNSETWQSVCADIEKPVGEFRAYVHFIDDPQYNKFLPEQILPLIAENADRTFIFIVDAITITHKEHPVLVMDLYDEPGRTFRVIPSEIWSVENNLSISNMNFEEFADEVDEDGIFRGVSES